MAKERRSKKEALMQFDKVFLEEALKILKDTADRKATMEILQTIKVEPDKEKGFVFFTATDLEAGCTTYLPPLTYFPENTEAFCVPAKKFYDVIKSFPEGRIVLEKNENQLVIKDSGENAIFHLALMEVGDFPSLPDFTDTSSLFELSGDAFYRLIDKTLFAVSKEEARFVLGGIYFEPLREESKLRAVASDGHRLVYYDVEVTEPEKLPEQGFIVPRKACKQMVDIVKNKVSVSFGFISNHAVLKAGTFTYFTRVIEGNFPDYRSILPSEKPKALLDIPKSLFVSALKQASLMADTKSSQYKPVVITKEGDWIYFITPESELGKAKIRLDEGVWEGEEMGITFNAVYLLEGLQAMSGNSAWVKFKLFDTNRPAVLTSSEDENFTYLVMPMVL